MGSDGGGREGDLGVAAGDMGTLSVSGAGMLQVGGLMNVGENGTGTLSITQGGQASSTNGFIGDGSDSNGTVSVAGANSTWSNSGNVYVGGNASGAVGSGQLQIVKDGT